MRAVVFWLAVPIALASIHGEMRVVRLPAGPPMAIWAPESAPGERFPLVLFSHGFEGCGTQSRFFTEELARSGYIVAAPDHRDAGCHAAGGMPRLHFPEVPFTHPGAWKDSAYEDRRRDLETALDWMLASAEFGGMIDRGRIGAAGHSLGGYSVLALGGAWSSWRDPRIRAILALAPYARPFFAHDRLAAIRIPVMYQAAQLDMGITPALDGERGAYARTSSPKYFVELRRGSHFSWTNGACRGYREFDACLENRANARLIVDYAVAFFDAYLKQAPERLRALDGEGLRAYRKSE